MNKSIIVWYIVIYNILYYNYATYYYRIRLIVEYDLCS